MREARRPLVQHAHRHVPGPRARIPLHPIDAIHVAADRRWQHVAQEVADAVRRAPARPARRTSRTRSSTRHLMTTSTCTAIITRAASSISQGRVAQGIGQLARRELRDQARDDGERDGDAQRGEDTAPKGAPPAPSGLRPRLRLCPRMLCRMPSDARIVISELPPWLTNGNGTPVTGTSLMFTPMFTNAWNRMNDMTPTAITVRTRRPRARRPAGSGTTTP